MSFAYFCIEYGFFIFGHFTTKNSELNPQKGCDQLPDMVTVTLPVTGITLLFLDFWVNGCLYFSHFGMEQTKSQ